MRSQDRKILEQLSKGATIKEAAKDVNRNYRTVTGDVIRLRQIFEAKNITEVIAKALREGVIA